jgi:hypothetical protein
MIYIRWCGCKRKKELQLVWQDAKMKDTFTIKTFGFGRDVCPKTISEIAHMKEGLVSDLEKID